VHDRGLVNLSTSCMTGDWLTSLRKLCDNAKNGSRELFFIVKFNLDIDISVIISLVFMSRV
jgi:hypothetical protein